MAQMERAAPELLDRAEVALHCKDWLYLNLTGVRATDPVGGELDLRQLPHARLRRRGDRGARARRRRRGLLPEIVDGTEVTHPLTAAAAEATGLLAGTPVSLGYVDMVMTALGAGVHTGDAHAACTVIGSTGVHLLSKRVEEVTLNAEGTGYVMALPVPGLRDADADQHGGGAQHRLGAAAGGRPDGRDRARGRLLRPRRRTSSRGWRRRGRGRCSIIPTSPRRASAGRSSTPTPAPASSGCRAGTGFPDLLRAVVEGLGFAARDCYAAMGALPSELRLTGGAARSRSLRGGPRGGGAGAGAGLGPRGSGRGRGGDDGGGGGRRLSVDGRLHRALGDAAARSGRGAGPASSSAIYDRLFPAYVAARGALAPVWEALAARGRTTGTESPRRPWHPRGAPHD